MTRRGARRRRWLGSLSAVFGPLLSLGLFNSMRRAADTPSLAHPSARVNTVCAGRFLIELPVEAQVNIGRGVTGGLQVATVAEDSDTAFAVRSEPPETGLAPGQGDDGRPCSQPAGSFKLRNAQGKVLVHRRRRGETLANDQAVEPEDGRVQGLTHMKGLRGMARADAIAGTGPRRRAQAWRQTGPVLVVRRCDAPPVGSCVGQHSDSSGRDVQSNCCGQVTGV